MRPDDDNRSQSDKFKQAARELGCDEDEDAFDRVLKQMKPVPKKGDDEKSSQ